MLQQNSLCFPCLEKVRTKFPVFPVPWPPCVTIHWENYVTKLCSLWAILNRIPGVKNFGIQRNFVHNLSFAFLTPIFYEHTWYLRKKANYECRSTMTVCQNKGIMTRTSFIYQKMNAAVLITKLRKVLLTISELCLCLHLQLAAHQDSNQQHKPGVFSKILNTKSTICVYGYSIHVLLSS